MKGKLLLILLGALPLWGAPSNRESLALQELRITTEEIYDQARSQKIALSLLQDRIEILEKELQNVKTAPRPSSNLESRLSQLEKAQKALLSDLHALQKHENETLAEVQKLKTSLQSMLTLLKQESSSTTYTVKSGDSLGQIAQKHKTDTRTLKKLNNLPSDTIYPGQKLRLPS